MRFGLFAQCSTLVMLLVVLSHGSAQFSGGAPPPESAFSIPQAEQIQPDKMNHLLQARGAAKPVILQVGSHVLFAESHIQGAEYAGAGSQPAGLKQLQGRVASLSHDTFIVLYCGCCPWNRCPNLGPAYWQLHNLGFTHVKVLYLADSFGADWVDKGYPVERGR
jgi:3-mercaptopyruvate sulfurtransferase SseA